MEYSSPSNQELEKLLGKLTREERVSLLAGVDWWRTPVIKREGVFVPHIKSTDGPNGARGESYVSGIKAACFPCGTCLGATFDKDLLRRIGQEVAKEAKTKGASVLLAPTLNVIRHPLGGRNYETYSEDPVVLGMLAAEYVNGCQSEGIAATPKHFVANEAENYRTRLTAEVKEQVLRELYMLPFQLVMKLSDPWCFMSSYNRVNGEYVADSHRLITQVLREEWGFKGAVISDWMGTYSTAEGIKAGVDLEMPGMPKWRGEKLVRAIEDGQVSDQVITDSARRILQLARRLGRFAHPEEPEEVAVENLERDQFIQDAAAEGMVLLKNEGSILPIPQGSTIALIGRHAFHPSLGGGGSARVDSIHSVSPAEGLKTAGFQTTDCPGVPSFGAVPHADPAWIYESSTMASKLRPVKLEWFNGSVIGENLAHEEMIEFPEYMIKEKWPDYLHKEYCTRLTFDLIPPTSGNHLLSVVSTGRSVCYINGELAYERVQETHLHPESFYFYKSKLERRFEYSMEAGVSYKIVLESWNTDPELLKADHLKDRMFQGSALRFHEHIDLEKRLSDACDAAKACDYAVVCVGTTVEVESEGFDRDTMDLSALQYRQVQEVARCNPKTIVVNFSGGPTTMTQFEDKVAGIIQAWFPGQECGHSLASVLSGKVNPSGRLPFSLPKKNEDNPAFKNFPCDDSLVLRYEEDLDVGYRFYDRPEAPEPLYPFGFGLSYTTFEITEASCSSKSLFGVEHSLVVSFSVKNTGDVDGAAVVQIYVEAPGSGVGARRPLRELKEFQKLKVPAGKELTGQVSLDRYAVSFYNELEETWQANPGTYKIRIGLSSRDLPQAIEFEVDERFTWRGV